MMVREIILDTETTGLDPASGDRIVEIGCVELLNSVSSGQTFHVYLDPERDVPEEAFRVHGLSTDFLKGKPKFVEVAESFINFIGDSPLIIHNADFDIKFLNSELKTCGLAQLSKTRVVDTLALARRKHPGASNSLDALCTRYKIDNSKRTKHGALLDAEILADVYIELTGGRQTTFALQSVKPSNAPLDFPTAKAPTPRAAPLPCLLSDEEARAHSTLVDGLGEKAFWRGFLRDPS
jgi:DNA polymerase-3 subunit epsilon